MKMRIPVQVTCFLVCALSIAASAVSSARAECAATALVARMLTPTTTVLPRDGGAIVLGLRSAPGAAVPMPQSITLSRGRRTQSLLGTPIAPGLVRFAAVSRLVPGPFSAAGLGAPITLTIGRASLPGPPVRPSVREMRRVQSTVMSARGALPHGEVRATLEFPVPAGIVAIVTYWGESGGAAAWVPAIQGQTEVMVWGEPARCETAIDGFVAPPEGAVGRIAYVDAFGQLSPVSSSVPLQ